MPNPSYPIHSWGFIIAGANVIDIENLNQNRFFSLFKDYVEKTSKKPLAVVINYPNNPTSETTNIEFYEEIVDFCKFHNIYIISDLALC